MTVGRKVVTCKWCQGTGFVWHQAKSGRWVLAIPIPGSSAPDPSRVHLCAYAPSHVNKRSYKASTYRLGKSPGSYA